MALQACDIDDVSMKGQIFRFAPSPNGYLHLGHAFSALLNRKLTMAAGGALLLRIEDIDPDRSQRHFEAALIEDLHWLGLDWSETPRRQSEHFAQYRRALDDLVQRGVAYPCFCSRGEIAKTCATSGDASRDPDGAFLYPGTCRGLSPAERERRFLDGQRFALRLDMAKALAEITLLLTYREFRESNVAAEIIPKPEIWGDVLIGRRDVPASYHLACVLDDHIQGITDVVRGVDLEPSTALHRLLQALLGLKTPNYHHHRLVLDREGRKLSKSKGAPCLRDLRAQGVSPSQVREELSRRMNVPL